MKKRKAERFRVYCVPEQTICRDPVLKDFDDDYFYVEVHSEVWPEEKREYCGGCSEENCFPSCGSEYYELDVEVDEHGKLRFVEGQTMPPSIDYISVHHVYRVVKDGTGVELNSLLEPNGDSYLYVESELSNILSQMGIEMEVVGFS